MATTGKLILLVLVLLPRPSHTESYKALQALLLLLLTKT
jgi:hypothetical protein